MDREWKTSVKNRSGSPKREVAEKVMSKSPLTHHVSRLVEAGKELRNERLVERVGHGAAHQHVLHGLEVGPELHLHQVVVLDDRLGLDGVAVEELLCHLGIA